MDENKINKLINNINDLLDWIKVNDSVAYEQYFAELIDLRKQLKIILNAGSNNPGIAAFGISQVGKSYLMANNFLQHTTFNADGTKHSKPYKIRVGGKEYDFATQINPPSPEGGGQESSGVVTRFSSFSRNPKLYNEQYPVLVKTLSLKDIIIVLSEAYYNNLVDYKPLGENEIKDLCVNLKQQYADSPTIYNPVISTDDIFAMRDYFKSKINSAQVYIRTNFFDTIALIIEKVPSNNYIDIFSKV